MNEQETEQASSQKLDPQLDKESKPASTPEVSLDNDKGSEKELEQDQESVIELMDDIEVVGPGEMLRDAREQLGLSQEEVAKRLNFRISLVADIENEKFDKSLAETFNRGYLRNYAKLVNVAEDDIIASYENLNIAELQCAEMQSFSNETVKQAENTLLMWVSYLIFGLLFAATIVWWMQSEQSAPTSNETLSVESTPTSTTAKVEVEQTQPSLKVAKIKTPEQNAQQSENVQPVEPEKVVVPKPEQNLPPVTTPISKVKVEQSELSTPVVNPTPVSQVINNTSETAATNLASAVTVGDVVNAQFTFTGDCWVNIFDATGERIAYGVKRSGYVMNISGVSPLKIKLGKPELVLINFEGENISTSSFARGDIAKFTLPFGYDSHFAASDESNTSNEQQ